MANLVEYLEKEVLREVKEVYPDYVSDNETSLPLALATIFSKQTKEKKGFVFIIDEWDCIIQYSERLLEATIQGNEEEVARLIEEVHSANISPNFYNNE